MSRELFLYSSEDCKLCEEMEQELRDIIKRQDVVVHRVGIDGDPELVHRYGARIPVLVAGNHELCELKLDPSALHSFLDKE